MMLGGKQMKPLGLVQWAGILLAGGSAVLTVYAIVSMNAQSPTALPIPLEWLLLSGLAGLLGGGVWVQFSWKTQ
jgi:hypothetical protein